MKLKSVYAVLAALLIFALGAAMAQEKMTKDQWQQEITKYTATRNDLSAKAKTLGDDVTGMNAKSTQLDADYQKCMDGLYALVGSDASKASAYRSDIESAESKANELSRLSDADLVARSGDVDALAAQDVGLTALACLGG